MVVEDPEQTSSVLRVHRRREHNGCVWLQGLDYHQRPMTNSTHCWGNLNFVWLPGWGPDSPALKGVATLQTCEGNAVNKDCKNLHERSSLFSLVCAHLHITALIKLEIFRVSVFPQRSTTTKTYIFSLKFLAAGAGAPPWTPAIELIYSAPRKLSAVMG